MEFLARSDRMVCLELDIQVPMLMWVPVHQSPSSPIQKVCRARFDRLAL
jgi:hypothetical protein